MVLGGQQRGSYTAVAKTEDGRKRSMNVAKSPFFQPSDPRALKRMSTPGGTVHMQKVEDEAEHKSTILGASANLIVSIVGAGIVGIPFAIKESGLMAGIVMVIFCAFITEKSLRLLIETAKHIDVPSYEVLYEASFGRTGFVAMSLFMWSMSYGAMVSYMMIMKDTISDLLLVDADDYYTRRAVLLATTVIILFPLSAQRDMADLAKTSKVSVLFYFLIVVFVVFSSPISTTVQTNGGWKVTVSEDIFKPETFFTGLGVLSFAYVCQHSAFIIAGSLKRPTKERWSQVTRKALLFSGTLATICGVFGYLGFLDDTDGNVLNNFDNIGDPLLIKLCIATRVMLCCCMFFVYPMDAFVSRHVCVVLLFQGRQAHEGDDHSVLARRDRRIALTCGMITITLIPALLLNNLGVVLAITGSIAGSFLSYIGPGTAYLAIHGEEFLRIVKQGWTWGNRVDEKKLAHDGISDVEATVLHPKETEPPSSSSREPELAGNPLKSFVGTGLWFALLMPVWVRIAQVGQKCLEHHFEIEALKSPHPSRLGKIVRNNPKARMKVKKVLAPPGNRQGLHRINSEPRISESKSGRALNPGKIPGYGSVSSGEDRKLVTDTKVHKDAADDETVEEDPQDALPKLYDFLVAIGFVVFGVIAMTVGLASIYLGQ